MKRLLVLSALSLLLAGGQGFAQQTPAAQKTPATASKPAPAEDAGDAGTDEGAPAGEDATGDGDQQAPIDFEGGKLTIAQPEEYGEKVLTYEGKELARDYVVYFNKVVKIGETNVALFDVGPGGNACGPAALIVWKPKDGDIQTTSVGADDCGAPPAAVTDSNIVFVPYVLPGASALVRAWSPETGLTVSGSLSFTPEPGTGWKDVTPEKLEYMIDGLRNEAVYKASSKLLGTKLADVVTGLSVSSPSQTTSSGVIYGNGCVPHACGTSDAFMAVDPHRKAVYFAQQGDRPQPDAWPAAKTWPAEIRKAMQEALSPPN